MKQVVKVAERKLTKYYTCYLNLYKIFSYDGENFVSVASTRCDHGLTFGLANYRGKALTTGSGNRYSDCYVRTEVYNLETNQWNDAPDYPFSS